MIVFKNEIALKGTITKTLERGELYLTLYSDNVYAVKDLLNDKEAISVISTDSETYNDYTDLKNFSAHWEDDKWLVTATLSYPNVEYIVQDLLSEIELLEDCVLELSQLVYGGEKS